ncbi:MAG TPA: DUF5996 family protein [Thermoanaerobaculia bacterium]|nr:DUF5996 family protein [Thermoanaerobaculia bacterium]
MTFAPDWPELPLESWRDTNETLHRWMQIVGKIALALTPKINHWWNVAFPVSPRGVGTALLRFEGKTLEIEFDLRAHFLRIRVGGAPERTIALEPRSVAAMHREIFEALAALDIRPHIWNVPVEIDDPIPLDRDETHRSYERDPVERFHRILVRSHAVFTEFRSRFIGKCSPVQFYWGSFDLAVTRFSGRPAPPRPDADSITREAYSHEVSSVGFWPGDARLALPAFYSYAAPEPPGFRDARVSPPAAYYHPELAGFYLHYDEVRRAADPERTLLDFCQSVYEAAANAGRWDRGALERR